MGAWPEFSQPSHPSTSESETSDSGSELADAGHEHSTIHHNAEAFWRPATMFSCAETEPGHHTSAVGNEASKCPICNQGFALRNQCSDTSVLCTHPKIWSVHLATGASFGRTTSTVISPKNTARITTSLLASHVADVFPNEVYLSIWRVEFARHLEQKSLLLPLMSLDIYTPRMKTTAFFLRCEYLRSGYLWQIKRRPRAPKSNLPLPGPPHKASLRPMPITDAVTLETVRWMP
jgi:hypothetical protein